MLLDVPSVSAFLKHKSDKSIGELLNAVTKNEAVQYAGTLLDLLHSLADHGQSDYSAPYLIDYSKLL